MTAPIAALATSASRRRRAGLARSAAGAVALAALLASVVSCRTTPSDRPSGGHRVARHVILIGLDGFRWDYVDRPAAQRIRAIAARGVRAERMLPVFPSKTFPNHYSLVTGLWAEEHGIVANTIRDPVLGLFTQRDTMAQSDARWWGGEPIWATVERQGRNAAIASWPGSEAAIPNRPTWYQRYDHNETAASKVAKVRAWLSLPPDSAPAFISVYFHDVDSDGHRYGPAAAETDSAIARVDRAVGAIEDVVTELGLRDQVAIIVVADHGMAAVAEARTIVLDDFLDLNTVDVIDWTPVGMLEPRDGDVERVFRALDGKHPNLKVYRKGSLPARWHFNTNPRITSLVLVADEGWTITSRAQLARQRERNERWGGAHGYDPELASMGAVFVAAGPGLAQGRRVPPFRNIHVYALMAHLLGVQPAASSGALDSVRAVLP